MSFKFDLLNNQINNIFNGIHAVAGLIVRAGEQSYRQANASDIVTSLLNGTLSASQKTQVRDALGISATGFNLIGHVASTGDLPTVGNQRGDCYTVGSSTPYNVYSWDGSTWQNSGAWSVSVNWGNIAGTLSAQTDINSALNNKQSKIQLTGILKGNGTNGVGTTSIQTSDVENSAITTAKMADSAVTAAKIAAGACSEIITATLLYSGWSALAESGAGYYQSVAATGLLTTDTKFIVDVDTTNLATSAAIITARSDWGKVYDVECVSNNYLRVCVKTMPENNIPVKILVVRK